MMFASSRPAQAQNRIDFVYVYAVALYELDSAILADNIKKKFPDAFREISSLMKKAAKQTNITHCAYMKGNQKKYDKHILECMVYYVEIRTIYNGLRATLKKEPYRENKIVESAFIQYLSSIQWKKCPV